jgi:hypothetical protein
MFADTVSLDLTGKISFQIMRTRFIDHKTKLVKWIRTIILMVSLFVLPGYAGNARIQKRAAIQNELIVSERSTTKSAVSYKKAFARIQQKVVCAEIYKTRYESILRLHSSLVKILLAHISEKDCPAMDSSHFIYLKTIPQSSDEDFSLSLRG